MSLQDAPFYHEIEALDENFSQFFYAYQVDWLERHQINFQAVQSLWDLVNNVYDNLDDLNISLDSLKDALGVVEEMNSVMSSVVSKGKKTDTGSEFEGTRAEYDQAGSTLLDKLYLLQKQVGDCRQMLIEMGKDY
jgi:hypothetical protein